jgi:hypothetical protein
MLLEKHLRSHENKDCTLISFSESEFCYRIHDTKVSFHYSERRNELILQGQVHTNSPIVMSHTKSLIENLTKDTLEKSTRRLEFLLQDIPVRFEITNPVQAQMKDRIIYNSLFLGIVSLLFGTRFIFDFFFEDRFWFTMGGMFILLSSFFFFMIQDFKKDRVFNLFFVLLAGVSSCLSLFVICSIVHMLSVWFFVGLFTFMLYVIISNSLRVFMLK